MEKKLSLDNRENRTTAVCDGFQLHYFPDITGADTNSRRSSGSDEECFQRSVPGGGDCYCGPTAADMEAAGRNLTVEEAEQVGYERGFCEGEIQGREAGEKDGLKKGRQSVQPAIDTLETLLEDLQLVRKKTLHDLEAEIIALTMGVARKIVGQELAVRPELVVSIIKNALSQIEAAGEIRIKLNPDDLELLNHTPANLEAELSDSAAVSFESDPAIASGGCIIETDAGNIDARLETQFQAIDESFQAAMSKDRSDG